MTGFSRWSLLLACALAVPAAAQTRGVPGTHTSHARINLRELAQQAAQQPAQAAPRKAHHAPMPGPGKFRAPAGARGTPAPAAVAPQPASAPAPLSPAPSVTFAALGDINTSIPPDTHGAAGPNHLMVTLNTQVRVQNKTTGATSTPDVTLDQFWSPVGGSPNTFDPKVLYDHMAGRWMFTAMADSGDPTSAVLIGVSESNDPAGDWNLFKVDADATNTNWADYPSMGFNRDWIAVNVNMFANSNNAFAGTKIYVFSKAALYNNATPAATHTVLNVAQGFTLVPAITYESGSPVTTLYLLDEGWADATTDFVRISTITGTVGSEVLTESVAFAGTTGVTWESSAGSGRPDSAPQLNTTNKIQNNDSRIQNVVYRLGRLWTTHNVFIDTADTLHRTAVQWWEVNPTADVGQEVVQRGRIESTDFFYAFPSIAVNASNDVLIGFSRFSANQFAGANYAFRTSTDTLNTMQSDVEFKAGEATYFKTFSGTRNRWGDYSNTVVDPTNDTDFWTIQEYAETAPGDGFDRWGTWWAKVVPSGAPKKREGQVVSE